MENIERDQPSIDGNTFPSSDDESEESTDTESPTSIDTAQPEAGKYSLTKPANEKVVQTELNGQTSNETSQTKQGTEIPVKENSTLTKGEDIKLSIQDYLDPGMTYSNRSAIKILGDDTKKSKFNADYYRMVRQNPFRGSFPEHPQDHIETLEELIPDEYDRCKLFSFSLEGEALRWLNCLATGSLTCWENIRRAFLREFFTDERYWKVRKQISTFRQGPRESFKNAWGRFRGYEFECPHHGYSEPQLLNIFYGGVNLSYKTTLDTASDENFITRNPEGARRLIKNMTTGRSYEKMDEEIEKTTNPKDNSDLLEIKNSLKSLHSFLQNKHRSDIAQIDENTLSDTNDYSDEETNCSDPSSIFHVESFTQAYDTALKSRTGRERFNIRQALTGNRKTKLEFYGKINMVYGELMEKADSLGELIRKLEGQVAEIATAIKRDAGCLPGRTDLNPRRQVSAVMLRSGKNLAAGTRNNSDVGKPDDADETGKSNSHPIFLDELDPNPSQDNRKTTTEKAKEKAIDLELEEYTEIDDEIDRQYGTDVDRPKTPTIDQQPEKPIDRRSTQPEHIIERVYRSLPPFPPKTQTKKSLENAICKKALDRISTLSYEKALRKKESRCPTKARNRSLRSDRARAKARSLRSDQAIIPLGRYRVTELSQARSLCSDRAIVPLGRYVATERSSRSVATDRAIVPLSRYVATELEPKLGRYVATERSSRSRPSDRPARSLRSDRARAKARSLRSDRAIVPLGHYVATELKPKLGRYVATEHLSRSITSIRHQSLHSRQNFECYLPKTVVSSVHVSCLSNSSIKLRGLKTAENS
ncbi:hypothetical protein IGI04_019249 [Brassica rapa subsp. trilocularis]|uniref:Retrotransposon gag domain-containing protein n=1 Tax=Brassica rapa subsp. trilocularis TaxID=1813537 RepID=A0ABQ7MHP1_BRACM|nr:hypothetical protein IGI04_019249 [Brassica rapa subsp. trilocularis]